MNAAIPPRPASVRIHTMDQLSLGYHFLALSFTTTSLLMGVLISEDSILYGLLGLLFVGFTQLLSAFFGALQYGRLWQGVHLMASACFIGVQIGLIALLEELNLDSWPDWVFWTWAVANILISLAAGWAYWFNLRSSYAHEAALMTKQEEPTMV
jgi:hypothetical protein